MQLKILGKPYIEQAEHVQTVQDVVVKYDERRGITTVNANVDIVTLGITIAVLSAQFEEYIAKLPEELQNKIKDVVKEVLTENG